MGASFSDTNFSTCAGILSGPGVLFGLISDNNLCCYMDVWNNRVQ